MFYGTIDGWFDKVVDAPGLSDFRVAQVLGLISDQFADCSKKKLLKVKELLRYSRVVWKGPVLDTINAIQRGDFRREFRFSYGGTQLGWGRRSQTTEFFSMLRQALTYRA